jgi:8-oxo-dGTP pyrophosphatase MutT (NUDIX family)
MNMRTISRMAASRTKHVCFIFSVVTDTEGTTRVICLPGCFPLFPYVYNGKNVNDMAIDCLNTHGLLNPRSSRPILCLSESPYLKFKEKFSSVYIVNLDPDALVHSSLSFGMRKLFSLGDSNGKTKSGKDITLPEFSRKDYQKLFESIRHECSASVTFGGGSAERGTGGGSAERASGSSSAARASGGGSAVHRPYSSRLTEVSTSGMGSVDHVFVVLFLKDGRILLVQEKKDRTWGFPGGNVDDTDACSWNAMKREFREETKNSLPSICGRSLGSSTDEPRKFHWYHPSSRTTSGFYCGQSSTATFEDLKGNFWRSHDIRDMAAVPVEVLFDMVNGTNPNRLRDCAIESTLALLLALGFRP